MKNKLISFAFYFGMSIAFIFLLYLQVVKRKNIKREIIANKAYTIGRVSHFYTTYGKFSGGSILKMECNIGGADTLLRSSLVLNNEYKNNKEEIIGLKFMVIYDSLDIKKCLLLFDYPVKDSSDYFRYMEEFEITPPRLKDGGWFSQY